MMAESGVYVIGKDNKLYGSIRVRPVHQAHNAQWVAALELIGKKRFRTVLKAHEPSESMNGTGANRGSPAVRQRWVGATMHLQQV